jgi:D-alanyl-D-alanine carboxypeptidase (penicillin-binding protein 5/6)
VRLSACACFLICLAATTAAAQNGRPVPLSAEAALVLDADGKVLYGKNAREDRPPASLVKLMTLYLAYEAIEARRVQWEDRVTVSRHAARTPRSRMGTRAGEAVAFGTLLEGVAIASANDAATAVAEHLAGSEDAFVEQMNAKARALGLANTRFANPHGLPDPLQRSTAEDMARLIGHLVEDYPASRATLGGKTFVFRRRLYSRHIPLLNDPLGVHALKTGFTNEAGYNVAVAAWREREQILVVVLGARTRSHSFRDAKTLLRYGFQDEGIESEQAPERPKRRAPGPRTVPRRLRASGAGRS